MTVSSVHANFAILFVLFNENVTCITSMTTRDAPILILALVLILVIGKEYNANQYYIGISIDNDISNTC